jgi:hypothetical protein
MLSRSKYAKHAEAFVPVSTRNPALPAAFDEVQTFIGKRLGLTR